MNKFVYLVMTKMLINVNTIECLDVQTSTIHFVDNNELKIKHIEMDYLFKELHCVDEN